MNIVRAPSHPYNLQRESFRKSDTGVPFFVRFVQCVALLALRATEVVDHAFNGRKKGEGPSPEGVTTAACVFTLFSPHPAPSPPLLRPPTLFFLCATRCRAAAAHRRLSCATIYNNRCRVCTPSPHAVKAMAGGQRHNVPRHPNQNQKRKPNKRKPVTSGETKKVCNFATSVEAAGERSTAPYLRPYAAYISTPPTP